MVRHSFAVALLMSVLALPVRAADDPRAVVARAIKAIGAPQVLGGSGLHGKDPKFFTYRVKITLFIQGKEAMATSRITTDGFRRYRQDFRSKIGGKEVTGGLMLYGHKGSRFLNFKTTVLNREGVDNLRHIAEMTGVSITVMPVRLYSLESIDDENVGGRPAVGVKVDPPDHKEYRIYFDKESGLPVKLISRVGGILNDKEFTLEWTFSDYRVVAGIKKAMKIEVTRDGQPFQKVEITEFRVLDRVDPRTFNGAIFPIAATTAQRRDSPASAGDQTADVKPENQYASVASFYAHGRPAKTPVSVEGYAVKAGRGGDNVQIFLFDSIDQIHSVSDADFVGPRSAYCRILPAALMRHPSWRWTANGLQRLALYETGQGAHAVASLHETVAGIRVTGLATGDHIMPVTNIEHQDEKGNWQPL